MDPGFEHNLLEEPSPQLREAGPDGCLTYLAETPDDTELHQPYISRRRITTALERMSSEEVLEWLVEYWASQCPEKQGNTGEKKAETNDCTHGAMRICNGRAHRSLFARGALETGRSLIDCGARLARMSAQHHGSTLLSFDHTKRTWHTFANGKRQQREREVAFKVNAGGRASDCGRGLDGGIKLRSRSYSVEQAIYVHLKALLSLLLSFVVQCNDRGIRHRVPFCWSSFVRRATHRADHLMNLHKSESWRTKQRRLRARQAKVVETGRVKMDTTSLHSAP